MVSLSEFNNTGTKKVFMTGKNIQFLANFPDCMTSDIPGPVQRRFWGFWRCYGFLFCQLLDLFFGKECVDEYLDYLFVF